MPLWKNTYRSTASNAFFPVTGFGELPISKVASTPSPALRVTGVTSVSANVGSGATSVSPVDVTELTVGAAVAVVD